MTPRISIAMATYNGEKYIKYQLDSLLNQTLKPTEIVIVDDRSTDSTYSILLDYAEKYPIIKVYQNEKNSLPAYTFRRAFELTSGDYIAPCDQDDIWFSDKLEKCYEYMSNDVKIIFHQDRIWYEDGTTVDTNYPNYTLNEILYSPRATGHTAFFERCALDAFNGADFITYDWTLILWGLATKTYKQITYVGCLWRRHETALTSTVSLNKHWQPIHRTKWGGVCDAINKLIRGVRSECIRKDMADIETILSKYNDLENYIIMSRCFQKQSFFSMLRAAILNVKCQTKTSEFNELKFSKKLARISFAFRYPFTWWLNLNVYLQSIGVS